MSIPRGMFLSDRCGLCAEYDEKVRPYLCHACAAAIASHLEEVLGEEAATEWSRKLNLEAQAAAPAQEEK